MEIAWCCVLGRRKALRCGRSMGWACWDRRRHTPTRIPHDGRYACSRILRQIKEHLQNSMTGIKAQNKGAQIPVDVPEKFLRFFRSLRAQLERKKAMMDGGHKGHLQKHFLKLAVSSALGGEVNGKNQRLNPAGAWRLPTLLVRGLSCC